MLNIMMPANTKTNGHMPSLFEDGFFSDFFAPLSRSIQWASWPAVDVHELKDKFVVKADMPGFEEKNIRIEFTDGALTIEGVQDNDETSDDQNNDDGRRVHIQERIKRRFKRAFTLGNGIEADKIQASYKNGTLTIEVPKAERAMPRTIPISASDKH